MRNRMMNNITKRHLIGLSLIICHVSFCMTIASCSSEIEPYGATLSSGSGGKGQEPVQSLSISPTTVTLNDDGKATATVTASVGLSWTVDNVPSWLGVSPLSGIGNATLNLTAKEENTSTQTRTATITLKASSQDSQWSNLNCQLTVSQPGIQLQLNANPTTVGFTAVGGTQTLTITSNTTWSIMNNASFWLKCNNTTGKVEGEGNATITLTATENTTVNENKGELVISGAGKIISVQVSQAGVVPALSVDQTNVLFVANGESKTIKITSNTSWTIESNVSQWLTCDKTSGSGDATIMLTAAKNNSSIAREGKLTISGSGITLSIEVSQKAEINSPSEDDNLPPKTPSARKR